MKPHVSVVIPTHNRRALLRHTLGAVMRQSDVSFEVIVVDDGSTDDTQSLVRELADKRVRLIRHDRPTGVSMARNHGASEAAGEWLAFCDDDDLWAPQKLAAQLSAAAVTGRSWAYGGSVTIDNTLTVRSGSVPPKPEQLVRRLSGFNALPGGSSNAIIRADVFWQVGGWDADLVNLADWDLWIRLASCGLPACVPEPLVGYRLHANNASSNRLLMWCEAHRLEIRYGQRLDYAELHHYLAWVALRSTQRVRALSEFVLAAVHGQVRPVVRSLSILIDARLRRIAGRPLVYYHPTEWRQRANTWLADLRENAPA